MRSTIRRNRLARLGMALVLASPLFGAGAIAVSPQTESVTVGGTHQMTAMVTGLANTAVTWSVNGMTPGNATYGSINPAGLYMAPLNIPNPAAVTIQATSVMNPTVYGTANLTVKGPAPVIATLAPGSAAAGSITLVVNGSGFQNGAGIYANGKLLPTTFNSSAKLTALTYLTQGSYSVVVLNPNSGASNALPFSVTAAGGGGNPGALTVSPSSVSVIQGLTQQFSATLNNAAQTVTWTATAGSITPAGLYTAPASIPLPNSVTITAKASNNSTASAAVTIASNVPPTVTGISQSPIPIGVFSMTIDGTGFLATSQATLGAAALAVTFVSPTQLLVTGYASVSGSSNITVTNGAIASTPFTVQVGVANPQVSAAAARRFLEQSAFGPSTADAAHVQQVGFQSWLSEQFATAPVSNFHNMGSQSGMGPRFISNAVANPDQLRQRVAFALSQVFVTSLNKIIWTTSMAPYQDMLATDAFVNFRQLLSDVTLHPIMGQYLDMANNAKGNAQGTTLPNENYAREVLQLFSIGTALLNTDGTPQVDAVGVPLPAYTQKTISEFARVFTGWSYAPNPGGTTYFGAYVNLSGPMIPYSAYHDTASKTLLNGAVITAGLTPKQDLDAALDNMFNHPNCPPFIAKLMIQHLVKSNPSPAYVGRVAAAFIDNGQGVRGDMKAVIAAVLLDQEARQNDSGAQNQFTDGHLQEPALYISGIMRALGAQVNDQNYFNNDLASMGEDIFNAPSVFNYYSPFYKVPGFGVGGPEFQIYSPHTSLYRMNFVSGFFYNYQGNVQTQGPGASVDLTPYVTLASTPSSLVDALDIAFTHGTMPSGLRQTLVSAVTAEGGGNLRRVQTALFLLLTSGYYNVWH